MVKHELFVAMLQNVLKIAHLLYKQGFLDSQLLRTVSLTIVFLSAELAPTLHVAGLEEKADTVFKKSGKTLQGGQ